MGIGKGCRDITLRCINKDRAGRGRLGVGGVGRIHDLDGGAGTPGIEGASRTDDDAAEYGIDGDRAGPGSQGCRTKHAVVVLRSYSLPVDFVVGDAILL